MYVSKEKPGTGTPYSSQIDETRIEMKTRKTPKNWGLGPKQSFLALI
jgi:hypothetical protein